MSLLVQNNQHILENAHISLKVNDIGQVSCLKGNLIKVTYITSQEAVILLQKKLYVA